MAYMKRILERPDQPYYAPFLFYISPSVNVAEKTTRLSLMRLMSIYCKREPAADDLQTIIKEASSCLKDHFQSLPATHTKYSDHTKHLEATTNNLEEAQEGLTAACKQLKLPEKNCSPKVLGFWGFFLLGGDMVTLTAANEVVKSSVDPRLTALYSDLSFYLLEKMAEANLTGKVSGQDIFSDLIIFFKSKNYSETAARELAFYFLGVYATRGASFLYRFDDFHPTTRSGLVILSLAISYLDKIAQQNGSHYALPSQFKTDCNMGKPYHFWLAAFIARFAQHLNYSKTFSYVAPILSGWKYDTYIDSNGRDIEELFKIKTPYDYYANMTRIDNWVRVMGSHFGRHGGFILPHDANEGLADLFKKARMPRKIPDEDTEGYIPEYLYVIQPWSLILRYGL
jgi:hypothetical protein